MKVLITNANKTNKSGNLHKSFIQNVRTIFSGRFSVVNGNRNGVALLLDILKQS